MKVLVVYYSKTGKTKLVAKEIAATLNANIRRVEEIKKRKGFLGFISDVSHARKEKCSEITEIKPMDFNLDNYDLLFLGTPVWALKPTPAINTFISKANFKDKKVIIFVTMAAFGGETVIKLMREKIEREKEKYNKKWRYV